MLKTVELIENIEEQYVPMLKLVNIPDFTKCIAQFSGLEINDVPNDVIKRYLICWAKNKYRFFKLFKDNLRIDVPFEYIHFREDIESELLEIGKEYPAYALWLEQFSRCTQNKIEDMRCFRYTFEDYLMRYGLGYKLDGTTITHFFKSKLNAPDDLVTKLGRIFENDKIKATYTMSIEPTDMMLASENPYNWQSCYRLEVPNSESHADGCLAAVLDTKSTIAYVWTNEGKFDLYDKYKFKSVRYKKMRQWLAIADDFKLLHFNKIYPGKDGYTDEFIKQLRGIAEKILCDYTGCENLWVKADNANVYRDYMYGYSEYASNLIWKVKGTEDQNFSVFDVAIECPCGCGQTLKGSYDFDGDEEEYNGEGFIAENIYEREYLVCPYTDDYCYDTDECCECNCEDCMVWQDNHPICDIDDDDCGSVECTEFDERGVDVDAGVAESCVENCATCPHFKKHHPELQEKEEEQTSNLAITTGTNEEQIKKELDAAIERLKEYNNKRCSTITVHHMDGREPTIIQVDDIAYVSRMNDNIGEED